MAKSPYCAAALLLAMLCGGGCSMCQQCELETYSAYGGRWQRTVRDHGRVGSVFAPAGAQLPYAAPAESGEAEDQPSSEEQDQDASRRPDDELPAVPSEDDAGQDEDQRLRDERARRLRELELEDIRYQRPLRNE